jgi:hypothetical protein
MLALDGPARAWEPRRLRLRLAATWPWATQLTAAITRLQALAPRLTSRNGPDHQERRPAGPWSPAHPARQPGRPARPDTENDNRPPPRPDSSRSRNIEASYWP